MSKICNLCNSDYSKFKRCNVCQSRHSATFRAKNKDHIKISSALYRERNKEKEIKRHARYRKENPNIDRINQHNRRFREKLNGGRLSNNISERLLILQKGLCACCGEKLSANFHLDHIMPIALGGFNIDSNIQLLHQKCNLQKHAKHPIDFMQEKGFLL